VFSIGLTPLNRAHAAPSSFSPGGEEPKSQHKVLKSERTSRINPC